MVYLYISGKVHLECIAVGKRLPNHSDIGPGFGDAHRAPVGGRVRQISHRLTAEREMLFAKVEK